MKLIFIVIGHSVFDIGYSSLKLIAMGVTGYAGTAEQSNRRITNIEVYSKEKKAR
jgi:hypothetical protein